MVSSSRDCPIALESLELYWNSFHHIFLIVHSLCRLMVRALLLMFLSLVYHRDPFLARCYIHCTHPLLARSLDVIKCSHYFYADDTQLYITFRTSSVSDMNLSNAKLVNCVRDMDAWMLSNKLKLNKDKSEVLVISSSYRPQPPLSSVDICNESVSCSPSAHNSGVIFDQSLCMVPRVNAVCQSSFFHLRNIGFIRKYLTYDAAKIIIHAFVVSKLDYCNSLLYGLPSYLIRKLQHVQILPPALLTSVQDFAILLQS